MKGFKKMRGKGLFKWPITHGDIGTSKCGTSTNMVLSLFSLWVPVPINVVPIPICYCIKFKPRYRY